MADDEQKTKPPKRLPVRWLTLAEAVGLLALVIAGLGYWDSHRERSAQDRDRAAAQKEHQAEERAGALKQTFLMTGAIDGAGDKIRLTTVHPEQVIQTQTVWFPTTIRPDSVETTGNPRLDAGWIEDGLRKEAGKQKQGRLPVGIETVYIEDGQTKTDRALYEIGYSLHSRVLRGDRVELEGLSLARRGVGGDLQTAAGGLWAGR
jgi:hypothetical protein